MKTKKFRGFGMVLKKIWSREDSGEGQRPHD